MKTVYIGMDVHKKFTMAIAMTEKGQIINKTKIMHGTSIQRASWEDYFRSLPAKPHAVLEATGVSYPIFESIEPYCRSVSLAHPKKTKLIAEEKVKTDTIDGTTLAHLKRTDFLPTAYLPPRDIRDQRELLRHRISLVHMQTALKNRIHSLLTRCGEFFPGADLFGVKGRSYLAQLPLREPYRQEVERFLRLLDHLAKEIKDLTRTIHQQVEITDDIKRLTTISGIGPYLAALIFWEIGDVNRFLNPSKLVKYAGLCASVSSTGGKTFYGSLIREGNKNLNWAMVQVAQKYSSRPGALGDFFRHVSRKHGTKVARVATARKILTILWHMLKNKEDFDEQRIIKDRSLHVSGPNGATASKHGR